MDDAADLLGLCARLLQHLARAQKRAARRIVGRRAFLPDDGAAVARIVDDEIGKSSPDVDAEGERCVVHSALILPCFTTFAQRSRSLAMYAANAAGPCPSGSRPCLSSVSVFFGSAIASRNILASDALMSSGKPAGPTRPNQLLMSRAGMSLVSSGSSGASGDGLAAASASDAHLAAARHAHDLRHIGEEEVDISGRDVGNGGRAAAIRHVDHLQPARFGGQEFRAELVGRTEAGRGIAHLAGVGLGVGDEFRNGLERRVHAHDQRHRHADQIADRHQLLVEVEGDLRARHDRTDRELAHDADADGVAVGRRLRDGFQRDEAAGAGLVVDDDGVAVLALDGVGRDAGGDVGGAARRIADQDLDRLPGHPLRPCRRGSEYKRSSEQASTQHD